MQRVTLACLALFAARICSAQSFASPATVDPGEGRHTMVQAAGMPLNDGALPPGMLTVRVVRGAFTADLAGETVTVDVAGGRQETARTGTDGRAQFAHLPIGAEVRVSALVENQRLTSESFALPPESGVRVLLVVDGGDAGAAVPSGSVSQTSALVAPMTSAAAGPVSTRRRPSTGVLAIRIFFTVATLAAFAFVLFRHSAPARRRDDNVH